jgi:hypothetical protein
MEDAVVEAAKQGINARMLLITNPGNPLGTLYPEATLKVWFFFFSSARMGDAGTRRFTALLHKVCLKIKSASI